MRALRAALALLLVALVAGCADSGSDQDLPELVPPGPGAITGVVVDEAVRPVAGALVEVLGSLEHKAETDEEGAFLIRGVAPGTHLLRASHGLYDTQQQTVEVVADDEAGARVKFQLNRLVFATPYSQTQKFDGFLVCSVGFSLYASEECGEGVGVPCEVPVYGCQRVGGQGNNYAQWDFYLDGPFVRSLVVEMTWEPTSPTLSGFELNLGTDWTCDPFCNGRSLNISEGPSPLYAIVDFPQQLYDRDGNEIEHTADTRFSTFVWPAWGSGDPQELNVAFNQPFQQFATAFYYLPAPPGWAFLAGDVPPF